MPKGRRPEESKRGANEHIGAWEKVGELFSLSGKRSVCDFWAFDLKSMSEPATREAPGPSRLVSAAQGLKQATEPPNRLSTQTVAQIFACEAMLASGDSGELRRVREPTSSS